MINGTIVQYFEWYLKSGLAVVLTDRNEGTKYMYVGKKHANRFFFDCTGGFSVPVKNNSDGCAVFPVHGGSVSVWIPLSDFIL